MVGSDLMRFCWLIPSITKVTTLYWSSARAATFRLVVSQCSDCLTLSEGGQVTVGVDQNVPVDLLTALTTRQLAGQLSLVEDR